MKLSVHKHAAAKRNRRTTARSTQLTVTRVDPLAMAVALQIANGDARRLRILDARTILVRNKAGPGA